MDIRQLIAPGRTGLSRTADPALPTFNAGDRFTAAVVSVDRKHDALLTFGRFKAYARLPLPVSAGQEIQIRVESDQGGGLRLIMDPPRGSCDAPSGGRPLVIHPFEPVPDRPLTAGIFRSLPPGTLVEGRITGVEQDGRMLVDFGRFNAFVRLDIPVRQGQTLPLVVVDTDAGLTLRVASRSEAALVSKTPSAEPAARLAGSAGSLAASPTAVEMETLRQALPSLKQAAAALRPATEAPSAPDRSAPLESALASIERHLVPANLDGDRSVLIARIADFVERSGIHFEKHLEQVLTAMQDRLPSKTPDDLYRHPAVREVLTSDQKPNLLVLENFLDQLSAAPTQASAKGLERPVIEMLNHVVQRSLAHIEQQQAAATQKPVDPSLVQAFSHLLYLADGRQQARLKVYYAKKGKSGEPNKPPRVSLLLEMDRLGAVRSDVWMIGKDLNITFFVGDENVKAGIVDRQEQIQRALKDTFNTVAVSVVVSAKKIAEFDGEDLSPTGTRNVDVSA